jgi:hypothetical protein
MEIAAVRANHVELFPKQREYLKNTWIEDDRHCHAEIRRIGPGLSLET